MIETAWRMNIAAALIAAATGLIAVPLHAADEAPEAKDAAPATPRLRNPSPSRRSRSSTCARCSR